jgi:hypothetical protein
MQAFGRIESPVVGYFDSEYQVDFFKRVRRRLPTVVHKVNRSAV